MNLVNGRESDSVSLDDRGLAYGDGVFRTVQIQGGRPLHWERHRRKLLSDCMGLGIPIPSLDALERDVALACSREPEAVLKIIVTRGVAGRGYAPPPDPQPTHIVRIAPSPSYPPHYAQSGVRLHLCALRLAWQPRLAGIKHLNRLENVLARAEWDDPELAEGLLLDIEDNAIEGTMSNLFIVEAGICATPSLGRCGVAGVQRGRVLQWAVQTATPCREENIPLPRLLKADEVFLVNSLIGLWPVREVGGQIWDRWPVAAQVSQWLARDDGA